MKHKTKFLNILFLLLSFSSAAFCKTTEGLKLSSIFSDNMVLQQGENTPVWGWGSSGSEVEVTIGNLVSKTIIKDDGKWIVYLPYMNYGGPYQLRVCSNNECIEYENVLVGEVWLASGQSNMEFPIKWLEKEVVNAIINKEYSDIRFFDVKKNVSHVPLDYLEEGEWHTCNKDYIVKASAVAYYFARELHADHDVPVGIIHSSWGGTKAEAWTSGLRLKSLDDFKEATAAVENATYNYSDEQAKQKVLIDSINRIIKLSKVGLDEKVHELDYDDGTWSEIDNPVSWEHTPLKNYVGFVWLRKSFYLENAHLDSVDISLGTIRYKDECYINGEFVGKSDLPIIHRHYTIPGKYLKKGKNVIAVRVLNLWGNGGFNGPDDEMFIQCYGKNTSKIDLTGVWKYSESIEVKFPKVIKYQNKPSSLYNAMIAPLIPYGIKGAIWYQGESNVKRAQQYKTLLPALIDDWQVRWNSGYLPFIIVQLANYGDIPKKPNDDEWAELREVQLITSEKFENVGLAVAIDIGEGNDIHPKNKEDVGIRLALAANHIAYRDTSAVHSGPIYNSMNIVDNKIVLKFHHLGGGLRSRKNEPLVGFEIAGADKKFVWANAVIENNSIVVWSNEIEKPLAVRYGWDDNPDCNLINEENLPASPFRTDNWKGIAK